MSSLSLDAARVQAFVQRRHPEFALRQPWRAEPVQVGALAARFARRCPQDQFDLPSDGSLVARCAGLMVYSMECYGCNFEDVSDVSAFPVAVVLAQISANNILNQGRRSTELCTRLGQADPLSQAVKLAELAVAVGQVAREVRAPVREKHLEALKLWIDGVLRNLGALSWVKSSKKFVEESDRVKAGCLAVAADLDNLRRLRRAREMGAAACPALGHSEPGRLEPIGSRHQ